MAAYGGPSFFPCFNKYAVAEWVMLSFLLFSGNAGALARQASKIYNDKACGKSRLSTHYHISHHPMSFWPSQS